MAFAATAEVGRFDEAIDWFSKRIVLTEEEALELGRDAGRRAFWIGNGLQLSQIQRVFDEIQRAQEAGDDFETWRKRVRSELKNDAHAETVFRNATQRALNAGRWEQMHAPDVAKFRPFLMFDAVLDGHTSEVCRVCNGTVLPVGHPWFLTHAPPCHHRCRSGLRSLRREVAVKRGITNVPPAIDADTGFGLAPSKQPVWKPDPSKHDPQLVRELNRKAKAKPKAPEPPREAPKEHDPAHWEAVYGKEYGEAAPNVAWGRAMLERGLDRSPADVKGELKRLVAGGFPGLNAPLSWLDQLEQHRPMRLQVAAQLPGRRALIALQEHTRTITTGTFPELSTDRAVRDAKVFYELTLDRSVRRPSAQIVIRQNARTYFSPSENVIVLERGSQAPVAIHELAHAIEEGDPRALARSLAFLEARTVGEKLSPLRALTPGRAYDPTEMARQDKFLTPYIGKDYGKRATEVTSVGYQALATDPLRADGFADLAERDPEMLFFLLGQLAGK